MKPPVDVDSPAPASREAESGWGVRVALGVVGFMMVVLFALPGFLAAGFSRMGGGSLCEEAFGLSVHYVWTNSASATSSAFPAERVVLLPAFWLMDHSGPMSRFYMWEFHLAGGQEIVRAD